jgi:hypothetical protein
VHSVAGEGQDLDTADELAAKDPPFGTPGGEGRPGGDRRADRLYISPKTADHHIQHVYTKIGVSTRAAAALWAMQHAVVR